MIKRSSILNIIITFLIISIISVSLLVINKFSSKSNLSNNSTNSNNYIDEEKKNTDDNTEEKPQEKYDLYEINYAEYLSRFNNNKPYIVLLTMNDCPHCIEYKPIANMIANDYKLNISFLSVEKITNEQYNNIHDTINVLKDQYYDNEKVIPTPTTIIINNNKEVSSKLGSLSYDKLKDFLIENKIIN